MKSNDDFIEAFEEGRSPHGERGLKSEDMFGIGGQGGSLSSWRAWIEIETTVRVIGVHEGSLSSWRAWIEIMSAFSSLARLSSLSSWRAWIEIGMACKSWMITVQSLSSWRAWIEMWTNGGT